jgi:hypothetical protein
MTAPPDTPAPEDGGPGGGSAAEGAPGVELGASEEQGSTFEPEEDAGTGS